MTSPAGPAPRRENNGPRDGTSSARLHRSDTRESHLRGADDYAVSMNESVCNRSRLSPRPTSMARHAPPECPSELTLTSKRSSRVTWKQSSSRRPLQDWSKSRPNTFHRDDRVPFKVLEVDEEKRLDVCNVDESLSGFQSARGGARDRASGIPEDALPPLTRWHLDKHVQRSGMAPCDPDELLHGHDTVEDWELLLVSEGKRSLLQGFNASKLQHDPEKASAGVFSTAAKTARDTLQKDPNTPHAVASTTNHTVRWDHAAQEEEEEELIARFYADQHARRRQPPPRMGVDPTPLPSTSDGNSRQPPRQPGDNAHVRGQPAMASSSTIPQHTHVSHVKRECARPTTEEEQKTTDPIDTTPSTSKKTPPTISTLDEFRQYVIQQKLQGRSELQAGHVAQHSPLPHTSTRTRSADTMHPTNDINETSPNTGTTPLPLSTAKYVHNNNDLLGDTKHVLDTNITNTTHPHHDKSVPTTEQQGRESIACAEEAERSAVVGAAHRGATVIAGAEALGVREHQGRESIAYAEEAERSAVVGAAHRGATVIAGAEALGVREHQGRESIAYAEEAERSAVVGAAHRGATVIAGAEALGVREHQGRVSIAYAEEAERSAVVGAAHRGATVIAGAEALGVREHQGRVSIAYAEEAERSAVVGAAHRGATVIAGAEALGVREHQGRVSIAYAEEAERSAVVGAAHRGATVIAGAEALGVREHQGRESIAYAEEAERSAVVGAAHRGATVIAGAEALGVREHQGRDSIAYAEEAERSAVVGAAHRGATVIAGAEALGVREHQGRESIAYAEEAERIAVVGAAHRGATVIAGAEALGVREHQGRESIAYAEEAERSAVVGAAHRGATVIAGAEALGVREHQGRESIAYAEEAERSAVVGAAHRARLILDAHCFYNGENVPGLKETEDLVALWPLRVGALNQMGVGSVEGCGPVSVCGTSLDAGVAVSDESRVCAAAVSRINDAEFGRSAASGSRELAEWNVGGVLLAEEAVPSVPVEAPEETEVQVDMESEVAVHPALRTEGGRPVTIPHGEPLGDDSDDDIPIQPRYTLFGCLLSPFVCCLSRRQTQMARIEGSSADE